MRPRVVLDPMKHPRVMCVSDSSAALAKDFQKFVHSKENDSSRKRHGPTGYHTSVFNGEFLDESVVRIPVGVQDEHAHIFCLPLKNKCGVKGVQSWCKKLGLCNIAPGTSHRVLASRLYTYFAAGEGDEGRTAAARCVEDDRCKRDPVPKNVNMSAILNSDFLFGSEALSTLLGEHLGRIRQKDDQCGNFCRGDEPSPCGQCPSHRRCRCTHTHKFVAWVKAFAHSVFKRTQKHYQRLSTHAGIAIRLALGHGDYICQNVMLRHMRFMFALGTDSWLQEPIDLCQEHSNVKPCKQEGRRQASSNGQLNARTWGRVSVTASRVLS